MTWNYRVLEFADPATDEPWQAIHEVHYDDAGKPASYSEDPAVVMSHDAGNNAAELGWVLDKMREALSKPALVERDFERPNVGVEPHLPAQEDWAAPALLEAAENWCAYLDGPGDGADDAALEEKLMQELRDSVRRARAP